MSYFSNSNYNLIIEEQMKTGFALLAGLLVTQGMAGGALNLNTAGCQV